ncbi:UvrD-helicase domain-containing protein [Humitalea sp. 24SJ18S-53]|uniref:UvrD-helicase domain-containing protein n=1 Tax=Humitalea sp. 24SJ18S-53 TaxID=3422307 RepID=UPI003D677E55
MFVWDKDDLNPEQVAAVVQPGNVFLVACPGSGKTRTLTYKIARQLSELQSDKQRVVAITYTHRAADEIHERIEQLGVDTSQLWIGTIHAFCLEWILRPYAIYHDALKHGFRVINAYDTERMHDELCKQAALRLNAFDCGHYFTPTGYVLTTPSSFKKAAVGELLEKYWANLRRDRQVDFELILSYAYKLIAEVPSISVLLGSLFSSVLVDEFQDTKEIQYAILAAILKASDGKATAFIVGDPNQAIYGSLGGYAITAADFGQQSGLTFREMELSLNYRSSERIVEYFGNFSLYASKIQAEGKHKDFPSLISFDQATSREGLEAELVRLIRYNIEVVGIAPNEICIVAPWWVHLASMTRRLVAALPEYSFDGPGMVPFARDIDNFWYKLSRIILTEASPQLYVRRIRWAGEVLAGLADAGVDISQLSRKRLLRECNSISIAETDGLKFLAAFFDALFEAIELDFRASEPLFEHYQAFFESSQRRIERLQKEGSAAIGETAMFRKVFASKTGTTVSTIHGVKGAEYDAVIAYGLLEGMVPHFSDPDQIATANKLLYVICSRARKNLHLLSEQGRPRGSGEVYAPTEVLVGCSFSYDAVP